MRVSKTNSKYNFIVCENYQEIYFGVFDVKIKDENIIVESTGYDYNGNPVVFYDDKPVILIKSQNKNQGIYINENNTEIPKDSILEEDYSEEEKVDNKEYILEEIQKSKEKAKRHIENLHRLKLKESKEKEEKSKKALRELLESTKEELVNEFIEISDTIKFGLFEDSRDNIENVKEVIRGEFKKQKKYLEEALANDLDSAYENFEKIIENLINDVMWSKKVKPLIEKQKEEFGKEITDRFQTIETSLTEKTKTKASKKDVKKLNEELNNLKISNVELNGVIQENKNKLDNKISNLKSSTKKLKEELKTHINESIEIVEKFYDDKIQTLREETFEIGENTRKFLIDAVNDSKKFLLEEIRNIQKEKPVEFIVESSKGTDVVSVDKLKSEYDKIISEKISNEMISVKKLIYASGGGTNAVQYQDGGTMNGPLTIKGALSAYGGLFDFVHFTTQVPTHLESKTYYDWSDHSLTYFNEQASMAVNIGREMIVRVRNHQQGLIPDGTPVYISGATDQYPRIELASASAYNPSWLIGLTTHDIQNNTFGYVTINGEVKNLNTNNLLEGFPIYLGIIPGSLTSTKPVHPNYIVQVGMCEYSHQNNGKILVNVQRISVDISDIRDSGTTGSQILSSNTVNTVRDILQLGTLRTNYREISTNYTVLSSDCTVNVIANSPTVTLPNSVGLGNQVFTVKNSSSNTITLSAFSTQTIDGSNTVTLQGSPTRQSVRVQSTNQNWILI